MNNFTPNPDWLLEMAEADEDAGFCANCGAEAYGVEGDARRDECDECGAPAVFGLLCWLGAA